MDETQEPIPYLVLTNTGTDSKTEVGRRFQLSEKGCVIGSSLDVDIRLASQVAEPRHARVFCVDGEWYIDDLTSSNSVFCNGFITKHHQIHDDGEFLRIGKAKFKFFFGAGDDSEYDDIMHRRAITDLLTDTYNRGFFDETLEREIDRSARFSRWLSLVVFDIDNFKKLNTNYGHLGGDAVLRELVDRVKTKVRKHQTFARYGGEEFALILPETDQDNAFAVADKIRDLIQSRPFEFEGLQICVTISAGIATTKEAIEPTKLIRTADQNLQKAKDQGKNRVITS